MLTYHFCETVTKSTRMAPEGYNECYHTIMRACWEGNDAVAVAELASHPDWLDRRIDCRHHPKRRLFFLLILLELWVSFFVSIILMIVRVIVPGTVLVKILVCLLVIPVQIAWGGVIFIIFMGCLYEYRRSHAATPLGHAVDANKLNVVQCILQLHPDLLITDARGNTPHDIARMQGFTAIRESIEAEMLWAQEQRRLIEEQAVSPMSKVDDFVEEGSSGHGASSFLAPQDDDGDARLGLSIEAHEIEAGDSGRASRHIGQVAWLSDPMACLNEFDV